MPILLVITDIYGNVHEAASDYKKRRGRKEIENLEQETVKLNRSLARWTFALAVFSTLTFFVSLGTLFILIGQLGEMHSGGLDTHNLAEAAKNQSIFAKISADTAYEAYVAGNRAYIGPEDASIQSLTLGKGLKILISYKNTGREPAGVGTTTKVFAANKVEYALYHSNEIANASSQCMNAKNIVTSFAFPSIGTSRYSLAQDTTDESALPNIFADQDMIDGSKSIYSYGCMTYESLGITRHTAFCYIYTAKKIEPEHLALCREGWNAD